MRCLTQTRICISYLHLCYARKLSTTTAFPLGSHKRIIKWLPTPFYTHGTDRIYLTPPPPTYPYWRYTLISQWRWSAHTLVLGVALWFLQSWFYTSAYAAQFCASWKAMSGVSQFCYTLCPFSISHTHPTISRVSECSKPFYFLSLYGVACIL